MVENKRSLKALSKQHEGMSPASFKDSKGDRMSTRHKGRRDKDYAMMHKAGQSPNNLKRFKGSSELQKHSSVKSKLGFADSDDDGNEDDEEGENEQEEE